tara:strand:- start:839 stop:1687 length:849 start_codon:yes stop_codon:yes gene_type:complete
MKEELSLREVINTVILFFIEFKILIVSLTILGVLSVVVFQKLKPAYYSANAIATSGISIFERIEGVKSMNQRTAINLINNLQLDIDKKDFSILASKLNIDKDKASLIKSIKAEQIFFIAADKKKYETPKFKINLSVKDNSIFMLVQSGLLDYFNNNEYISNHFTNFQQTNNHEISTIENEIYFLQSLRLNQNSKIDMSSFNLYTVEGIDIVQNQIVELTKMRSVSVTVQSLLKPLSFVQEFSISQIPERAVLIFASLAALISFLIAIVVAVFINVSKKAKYN